MMHQHPVCPSSVAEATDYNGRSARSHCSRRKIDVQMIVAGSSASVPCGSQRGEAIWAIRSRCPPHGETNCGDPPGQTSLTTMAALASPPQ